MYLCWCWSKMEAKSERMENHMKYSKENSEKTGYLEQEFRLFHIKDQTKRSFSYHYHDFHKVVVFLSGKAAYHIEGKSYYLKPWDILLVDRHAHRFKA